MEGFINTARPLPNLALRSLLTLGVLYGFLTLLLIIAVELGFISSLGALIVGLISAMLQYLFAPWILDLTLRFLYRCSWVPNEELPEDLRLFVDKVCAKDGIRFPHFCVLDDGAPQAFTYGHSPRNARIVISRGTMTLLTPHELEAVVAHELGHICHWDMVVMTIAQVVPLISYSIYRAAVTMSEQGKKNRSASFVVAIGAYVVYIVSQLAVLWFSRLREYYADQFAGERTNNPAALASALVKIGYGLAAGADSGSSQGKSDSRIAGVSSGALGALNIFDRKASLGLVVSTGGATPARSDNTELVKDALQWDLWNPWALYYEIQATHPLIAKRLERLAQQSIALGQPPYLLFDREQPESYWDEFFIDLAVVLLPKMGLMVGLALLMMVSFGAPFRIGLLGMPLALCGAGSLVKALMQYRRGKASQASVASLLKEVKVSPVRTSFVLLSGKVIGRGVPGYLWSEDFVLQDQTGIIFLDYRQPLPIWDFLFGVLRAGSYTGKSVEVSGWYRRAPVPYLEIATIREMEQGVRRSCYTSSVKWLGAIVSLTAGVLLLLLAW
jgi:heat shock protein HtpX